MLIAAISGGWLWSNYKISKLERRVEDAKVLANAKESQARAKEIQAAEYKQKIEYLETQLAEIGGLAEKDQDEEFGKAIFAPSRCSW